MASVHTIDLNYLGTPGAIASYVVIGDRDYWGKGVVLEARGALLDFLFDVVGVSKVWGTPFERNFPSIFNYKAQGFTCEGVLRKHVINVKGKRVDQYIFGLLRDEWHAHRAKVRK